MRCRNRIIEVYRANKERKDHWADRPKGWNTIVIEEATERTEELISRWVNRSRSRILLQDGYHVYEPRTWRENARTRYASGPQMALAAVQEEDATAPQETREEAAGSEQPAPTRTSQEQASLPAPSRTSQEQAPQPQAPGPEEQGSESQAAEDKGKEAPREESKEAPCEENPGQSASSAGRTGSGAGPAASPGRKDDAEVRAAAAAVLCAPNEPKDTEVLTYGKHKGRTFQEVLDEDVDYVSWTLAHCGENSSPGMHRFKDWLIAKAGAS